MAINVTFWCLPEDEIQVLDFIEKDPRVFALPLETLAPVSAEAACSPRQLIHSDGCCRMLLGLRPHLPQVVWVQYEKDGKVRFGVDAVNSPVLSFSRSVFRQGGKLGQGVVSAHLDRLTADKTKLVAKPDEFRSWAKGVISDVRKKTPKWHAYEGYRISERVAEGMETGLELVF